MSGMDSTMSLSIIEWVERQVKSNSLVYGGNYFEYKYDQI